MEDKNEEYSYLSTATAFKSLSDISSTYKDGLTRSILDLIESSDSPLSMSDILEKFGSYETIHDQVKRLLLDNRLILYETAPNSLQNNDFKSQELKIVDSSVSEWRAMAAQPCLTCPFVSECGIDNPVSPATCAEMNSWIKEEIDLEFDII